MTHGKQEDVQDVPVVPPHPRIPIVSHASQQNRDRDWFDVSRECPPDSAVKNEQKLDGIGVKDHPDERSRYQQVDSVPSRCDRSFAVCGGVVRLKRQSQAIHATSFEVAYVRIRRSQQRTSTTFGK